MSKFVQSTSEPFGATTTTETVKTVSPDPMEVPNPEHAENLTLEAALVDVISVFDEDAGKDDPLGNIGIDTYAIQMQKQVLNLWIPLQNCKSGQLPFSSEFIPLTNQQQQAIEESTKLTLEENSPNHMNISAFNEDFGKDDCLGDANINLNEIFMDENNKWITRKNCKSGKLLTSIHFLSTENIVRKVDIRLAHR